VPLETIQIAESLIDNFQFESNFKYEELENPAVQHVYSVLQAFALNEESSEWIEERDDKMKPDSSAFEVMGDIVAMFKAQTGVSDEDASTSTSSRTKRAAGADGEAPKATKKTKGGAGASAPLLLGDGTVDLVAVGARGTEEELMTEQAATLKEICRAMGLPVSGTKAVLVSRIVGSLTTTH